MALGGALGLAWSPVTPGMPRHFAWQAWHKITSTVVLRGRRGTNSHPTVVLRGRRGTHGTGWRGLQTWLGSVSCTPGTPRHCCVAGVAQTHIHRRFAWQAWHSWHWVARLDWLRRRRDACDAAATSAWQAWHKLTSTVVFTWQAWHKLTSTVVLRGRRGTHGTGWRAWTGLGRRRDARDAAALLRGRRGTNSHPPSFSRGRRGTTSHPLSFCVAGVAQHTQTPSDFAWQAWHTHTSHTGK